MPGIRRIVAGHAEQVLVVADAGDGAEPWRERRSRCGEDARAGLARGVLADRGQALARSGVIEADRIDPIVTRFPADRQIHAFNVHTWLPDVPSIHLSSICSN